MSICIERESLSNFTQQDWFTLRVYQDFDQRIIIEASEDLITKETLQERICAQLSGTPHTLFKLTCEALIAQLIQDQRLTHRTDGILQLTELFKELIHRHMSGDQDLFAKESLSSSKKTQKKEETQESRVTSSLNYIDPLSHVSADDESLFTTRRLNQILSSLDGLTLLRDSLQKLLSIESKKEIDRLLNVMERFELTRSEGGFIKLHFHGNRIVRLSRTDRLKTLGRIASRMRREED